MSSATRFETVTISISVDAIALTLRTTNQITNKAASRSPDRRATPVV
jgi:hypothetical protein